jgi:hypothetical protein
MDEPQLLGFTFLKGLIGRLPGKKIGLLLGKNIYIDSYFVGNV